MDDNVGEVVDELPKTVWLRGNESYFKDFNLDAETVMSKLSIRRSRLNQISGNELRVGKARIDRYLRPVYRQQDVEDYLRWTRATASHQRSSFVLNEACQRLEERCSAFEQELEHHRYHMDDNIQVALRFVVADESKRFVNSVCKILQRMDNRSYALYLRLLDSIRQAITSINEQDNKLKEISTLCQALPSIISGIQDCSLQCAKIATNYENVAKKQNILEEKIDTLISKTDQFSNMLSKPIAMPSIQSSKRKKTSVKMWSNKSYFNNRDKKIISTNSCYSQVKRRRRLQQRNNI